MIGSCVSIGTTRDGGHALAIALGLSLGAHALLLSLQQHRTPKPSLSPAPHELSVQLVAQATGNRPAPSLPSANTEEPKVSEVSHPRGGGAESRPERITKSHRNASNEQQDHYRKNGLRDVDAKERGPRDDTRQRNAAPAPVDMPAASDIERAAGETPPRERELPASIPPQSDAGQAGAPPSSRLLARIRLELARHFTYPWIARRRGWEGTVVLGFRLLPDGRIDDIEVRKSSGHRLLDLAARRALARVGRIRLDDWRPPAPRSLELPVEYRLIDS